MLVFAVAWIAERQFGFLPVAIFLLLLMPLEWLTVRVRLDEAADGRLG